MISRVPFQFPLFCYGWVELCSFGKHLISFGIKNVSKYSQSIDKELVKRGSRRNKDQTLFMLCLEVSSQFTVFLLSGLLWYAMNPMAFLSVAKSILAWLPARCFLGLCSLQFGYKCSQAVRSKLEGSSPLPSKILLTREWFQDNQKYLWIQLDFANCFEQANRREISFSEIAASFQSFKWKAS